MKSTTINATASDSGSWTVVITGALTEEMVFPKPPDGINAISVDLGDVEYINSTGVRGWLVWITSLLGTGKTQLEVKRAPLAFLRLMEFIKDIIPQGGTLSSYFVSYACLECAKVHHVEVKNEVDATKAYPLVRGENPPACSECKNETELELAPAFYQGLSRLAPK